MTDVEKTGPLTEGQVRIVPANEASWDDLVAIFGSTTRASASASG